MVDAPVDGRRDSLIAIVGVQVLIGFLGRTAGNAKELIPLRPRSPAKSFANVRCYRLRRPKNLPVLREKARPAMNECFNVVNDRPGDFDNAKSVWHVRTLRAFATRLTPNECNTKCSHAAVVLISRSQLSFLALVLSSRP